MRPSWGQFTPDVGFIDRSAKRRPGTAIWTAANGDQIFTTIAGQAGYQVPHRGYRQKPGTITGGTGQFAEASGSIALERSLNLLTFISSGSFTGTINLGGSDSQRIPLGAAGNGCRPLGLASNTASEMLTPDVPRTCERCDRVLDAIVG